MDVQLDPRLCSDVNAAARKDPTFGLSWGQQKEDAYMDLKEQLCNAVKLAHRDQHKSLCLYTDASDRYWSAVITQCHRDDLKKETRDQ